MLLALCVNINKYDVVSLSHERDITVALVCYDVSVISNVYDDRWLADWNYESIQPAHKKNQWLYGYKMFNVMGQPIPKPSGGTGIGNGIEKFILNIETSRSLTLKLLDRLQKNR